MEGKPWKPHRNLILPGRCGMLDREARGHSQAFHLDDIHSDEWRSYAHLMLSIGFVFFGLTMHKVCVVLPVFDLEAFIPKYVPAPMSEFDAETVRKIVDEIELNPDGSIGINFKRIRYVEMVEKLINGIT